MERLIRLLKIIDIINNHPGINAKQLATELDVSIRTIYRDIDVISLAYIPITTVGHGMGYHMIGSYKPIALREVG